MIRRTALRLAAPTGRSDREEKVMIRRTAVVLALLVAAVAGTGAARAPGDPALTVDGPASVVIGLLGEYTLEVTDPATPPEAGDAVQVSLPPNLIFAGGYPVGDNNGRCDSVDSDARRISCAVEKPAEPLRWKIRLSFEPQLTPGEQLTITAAFGDLTGAFTATAAPGADLGITEVIAPPLPLTPGEPMRWTAVVHNFGPGRAADLLLYNSMAETVGRFHRAGKVIGLPGECSSDPGYMRCSVERAVEPGQELRVTIEMPTGADAWGVTGRITVSILDYPGTGRQNEANSRQSFPVRFAARPSATTAAPAPSGSPGGGGLPITGSATLPLVAGGLVLLLAGGGVLLLTRRRATRA